MLTRIFSYGLCGLEACPVTIEVDVTNGLPITTIVGLPDSAIKESKDRIKSAIKNSGFSMPIKRIIINLSPADIKKEGPSFDLPMALGILAETEYISKSTLEEYVFIGELSLDGRIQPIKGALTITLGLRNTHFKGLILPSANAKEASLCPNIDIFPVNTLAEVVFLLNHSEEIKPLKIESFTASTAAPESIDDFSDVKGQAQVKRTLEIAAAGGHNILLVGTQYNRWNLRWWELCHNLKVNNKKSGNSWKGAP